MQNSPHLIVAVSNTGLPGHMLGQAFGRPGGKTIPQLQRTGLYDPAQEFAIGAGGATRTPRGFARYHGRGPSVAIKSADSRHGIGATSHLTGDGSDGLPRIAQQDDQAVAIYDLGRVSQAQTIQFVPLGFGEFDAVSHGFDLPAAPPPPKLSTKRCKLYESFCVST